MKDRSPAQTAQTPAPPRRVTRDMVYTRTRTLALHAGRVPPHVLQIDYEQAKRELTGESDPDRQEAVLSACQTGYSGGLLSMEETPCKTSQ